MDFRATFLGVLALTNASSCSAGVSTCEDTGSCPGSAGGAPIDLGVGGDKGGAGKTAEAITSCVGKEDGALCGDGNACTVNDICGEGICFPGAKKVCPAPPARSCQDEKTRVFYEGEAHCLEDGQCADPAPQKETCSNGCLFGECIKIKQVATGRAFTCALFDTGNVRCWGSNQYGQLGQQNASDVLAPKNAEDLPLHGKKIKQIGAGYDFACALSEDGLVYCWGSALDGRLGNGHGDEAYNAGDATGEMPVGAVPLGSSSAANPIEQLSVGWEQACVRLKSGAVRCWGDNAYNELGNGQAGNDVGDGLPVGVQDMPPQDIVLSPTIREVTTGRHHTCVLLNGGSVRCWGGNFAAQLGYSEITQTYPSTSVTNALLDINLPGPVSQVVTGAAHTCAITDGNLRCWGDNTQGQLGYGRVDPFLTLEQVRALPTDVVLSNVKQVALGQVHTCALLNHRGVRCWGYNKYGQHGLDDVSNRSTPPSEDINIGGTVEQISTVRNHVCALLDTGVIRCWGQNHSGACGYGTTKDVLKPMGDVLMY